MVYLKDLSTCLVGVKLKNKVSVGTKTAGKVHLIQCYSQRHKNEQHFRIICIN